MSPAVKHPQYTIEKLTMLKSQLVGPVAPVEQIEQRPSKRKRRQIETCYLQHERWLREEQDREWESHVATSKITRRRARQDARREKHAAVEAVKETSREHPSAD